MKYAFAFAVLFFPATLLGQMNSGGLSNDPSAKLPYVQQDDGNYTREASRMVDQPGLIVSKLANGLTVIASENHQLPVAAVRMYVKTGSIYEQEYLGTGISHLFEHLLAGGTTEKRSEAEIERTLKQLGGATNAYTTIDHTCYYIDTTAEGMPLAVDLLADFITRPKFPQNEFQREWGVVQRELDNGKNDAGRQLYYATMENVYSEHPARFPVIGHQQALQAITLDMIKNYYKRMYVPDNVIVSICGDFKAEDGLKAVQKSFMDFKRRPVVNVVLPDQPEPASPTLMVRRLPNVQGAAVNLSWLTVPLSHDDLYALDVLDYVLTNGRSSRLYKKMVEDDQLMFDIGSSSYTPEWGKGYFSIQGRCETDKLAEAIRTIQAELAAVAKDGVTADELARAKRQKLVENFASRQEVANIAADLASNVMSTGDVHFSDVYAQNIQKVTPEQVKAVAAKYLQPQRLRTTLLLPTNAPLPKLPQAPSGELGPWFMEVLPGGLVVLVRRNTQVPMVDLSLMVRGGLLDETPATSGTANLTAAMLTRGTSDRSGDKIAEFFDGIGGGIGATAGNNSIILSASCFKDDLPKAIEVFADCWHNSIFPDDSLREIRPILLHGIKTQDENPQGEVMRLLKLKQFGPIGYGLTKAGTAEVVSKLTPTDLQRYMAELAGRPRVLAIVGDVDPQQVLELVKKLAKGEAASAPAASQPASQAVATSQPAPRVPGIYVRKTDKQVAAIAMAFSGVTVNDRDAVADLDVLDTVVSGYSLPGGWLHNSLRGLGGRNLVYVVHAVNQPMAKPGMFMVYALCQPEKAGEVLKIIQNRLERAKYGDFSEEAWQKNLAEVKAGLPALLHPPTNQNAPTSQPAGALVMPPGNMDAAVWALLSVRLEMLKGQVGNEQAFEDGLKAIVPELSRAILAMNAGLGQAGADTVAAQVVALASQARYGFIGDDELVRAKSQILTTNQLDRQTLADQVTDAGVNELLGLGFEYSASLKTRVDAVTKQRVVAAARKYLNDAVIVICTPDPGLLGLKPGEYTLIDGK